MPGESTTTTTAPVIVIGLGQLGTLLSDGLRRAGHDVIGLVRSSPLAETMGRHPRPRLVLAAVGEDDLAPLCSTLVPEWLRRIGLMQNELLPRTWQELGIEDPTVAVVWFERKDGRPPHVLRPTPLSGPGAPVLGAALGALGIPARVVNEKGEALFAMVAKNVYILTVNCAGLETGGTVGELFERHGDLADRVANEVLDVQEHLVGHALDRPKLIEDLHEAAGADPEHVCVGRTAPARLRRLVMTAHRAGIDVPTLGAIAQRKA